MIGSLFPIFSLLVWGEILMKIIVRDHEHIDGALRRFKRAVEQSGLIKELRDREFYEKPTAERKRKHASAVKRHQKRIASQNLPPKLF